MSELRGDLMILRSRNVLGQILLLAYREKSVTVYAYDRAIRLDASEGFADSSSATSDVIAVHRIAEVII